MATDLERLVVQLSADVKKYENALNKAMGQTNRQARRIEGRFQRMNKNISASFVSFGRGMVGALAAGITARELQQLSDAATRIDNALKVAGLSGEELERVYERLRDSAVRNAAPIESLVELYGRAALVQKELGISSEELLNFTDKIAVALRVSGKSAAESSGALLQLSQALGSGVVRAEEFNSILEGALPIAQAAAAGLEEAGGSVAKLRSLVIDGAISSEVFFRAFEAGSAILEDKVAGAQFTVSQSLGNLRTSLIDAAREFNNATGASEKFADGINAAAKAITDFDVTGFVDKVSNAHGALIDFLNDLGNAQIFKDLNEALGITDSEGNLVNLNAEAAKKEAESLEKEVELLQATIAKNTELGFDNTEALARLDQVLGRLAQVRAAMANMPLTQADPISGNVSGRSYVVGTPGDPNALAGAAAEAGQRAVKSRDIKTVSLSNFTPPAGSGSGSKSTRERADEYERLSQRIAESTANIVAETEAIRGLDPLVEDYGYTLEKARATQELMNAALEAGKTITPELRAQIGALAEQYALATAEAAKLAESQDQIRERAEDMRDFQKDLTRGIVDGFLEGRDAAEIFADALKKVGDRLLDMAFDSLFGGGTFGGGGFGILGALFGGGPKIPGFASGTNFAPGGLAVVGEKGPELVNLPRGSQVIPNHKLGGGASITYAPVIDARGADSAAVARLEQVMAKDRAEFEAKTIAVVRKARGQRKL